MLKTTIFYISLLFLISCKSRLIVEPKIIYNRIENHININSKKSDSIVVIDNNKVITPTKNNRYLIDYENILNNKKTIKIITYRKNNNIDSIHYSLKAKNLKCSVEYKINGKKNNAKTTKSKLKNAVISAYSDGFIYNNFFEITEFKVKIPGFSIISVKGNMITDEIYNIIQNIKKGENIFIQIFDINGDSKEIKWKPIFCTTHPLIIEIKNNR